MKEKHTTTRYFATDCPRPTRLIEVDENYFGECRLAGAAAEVVDGRLEVTYQGALLRTVPIGERYTFWPATG